MTYFNHLNTNGYTYVELATLNAAHRAVTETLAAQGKPSKDLDDIAYSVVDAMHLVSQHVEPTAGDLVIKALNPDWTGPYEGDAIVEDA